jgi:hypothetical protein
MMTFTNNVFNLEDTIYYVALKEKNNIRNLHCSLYQPRHPSVPLGHTEDRTTLGVWASLFINTSRLRHTAISLKCKQEGGTRAGRGFCLLFVRPNVLVKQCILIICNPIAYRLQLH